MSLTLASTQCEQQTISAKNPSGSDVVFAFAQCKRNLSLLINKAVNSLCIDEGEILEALNEAFYHARQWPENTCSQNIKIKIIQIVKEIQSSVKRRVWHRFPPHFNRHQKGAAWSLSESAVADPGFPRQVRRPGFLAIFWPKNCMKMKEIGPRRGGSLSSSPPPIRQ